MIVVVSAAVAVAATTVAVAVVVTAVTVTAVSATITVVIAVVTAVVVAATNVSCCPLTAPPSCHLAQAGCCVASCYNALLSSRSATLLSYRCPLTAPPSCCLISPGGCCVASCCTALSLSSHSAALVILRWLVVASPLVAPPSRHAALLSSPFPLTALPSHCLISPAGCCVASRHAALLSSSYSFALSSSCAGCRSPGIWRRTDRILPASHSCQHH